MKKISHKQLYNIISKTLKIKPSEISLNSKACDFNQWDSLTQIKLALGIEKIIKKKINTSLIGKFNSIKNIINYLKKNSFYQNKN